MRIEVIMKNSFFTGDLHMQKQQTPRRCASWSWFAPWIFLALMVAPLRAQEEEYVIERDDLLSVTFWQQPSLNTQIRVAGDGSIELPVVGRVNAAGFTTSKLEQEIVRQFAFYNAKISRAAVSVVEFGSKKVYINGQVTTPGKFTFASMPTIWQAILEAGGPLENANLGQVTVVRGSGDEVGKVLNIDLAEALNRNTIQDLPKLMPGDIIYIPAIAAAGTQTTGRSPLQRSTLVYLYGEVARPGAYQYEANTNVLQAVINAGGPTAAADMEHVRLMWLDTESTQVADVNLSRYSSEPYAPPLLLQAGDMIYLPKKRSFFQAMGRVLTEVFRLAVATGASILVFEYARN